MVFRITNYCNMGCKHCMQNSTTRGKHASKEIIDKMIRFAELAPLTTTIQISGGEPTEHPDFIQILKKVLKKFSPRPITIITNGEGFHNKEQLKKVIKLMEKYPHLMIQITSVKGIYKNHDERIKFLTEVLSKKKLENVKDRIIICTELENGIIPIGRALDNLDYLNDVSFIAHRKSTSCFNMYNSLLGNGGNLFKAIDYLKTHSMASFCKPLIKETGEVVFGEYDACTTIINLAEISLENMDSMTSMTLDISEVPGPCKECINTDSQLSFIDQYLSKYKYE